MDARSSRSSSQHFVSRVAPYFILCMFSYIVLRSYTARSQVKKMDRVVESLSSMIVLKAVHNALDEEILYHHPMNSSSTTAAQWDHDVLQLTSNWAINNDHDLQCLLDTQPWNTHNRPPSSSAQSNRPCTLHTPLNTITSASELCTLLAGKRVLLVGPETTFHLHMNWLRDHELHENRSHRCSGPENCNSHQICLPSATAEETKGDVKKLASTRELEGIRPANLRYALSNTLYAKGPSDGVKYTSPVAQVDPFSGVQLRDSYWLGQAKKSDVLILNRRPLPAPSQTYDGTSTGNWTFLEDVLYSLDYMEKKTQYGSMLDVLPNDRDNMEHRLVVAALYVTLNTFLPSTLETVRTLRSDRATRDKVLVWHGSWFISPPCLSPLGTEIDRPEDALFATLGGRDYWLLYHNAQVYMQNYLLRSLLPQYDVSFIPQAGLSYHIVRRETVDNSINRKDCLRYTHGSPMEEAMRITLLTGVSRVIEAL